MTGCIEKRFSAMRHHYELGLLSAEDRQEFELHLLDCEACFESVERFRNAAEHIRHNPKVRSIIGESAAEPTASAVRKSQKSSLNRLIPAFGLAVVITVFLILKPWEIQISPTKEAIAAENRLAILPFTNLADPDDSLNLGRMISDLLITDLSSSHYMQLISGQRLLDIAKLLEKNEPGLSPTELTSKIASKAEARWILTGSIHQYTPIAVLTCQLVEVESGVVVASLDCTSDPNEDIFALVDRLSAKTKSRLTLPPAARQETDYKVADVTTYSAEAYRYYVEGLDLYSKYYMSEAAQSFYEALNYDSTFAMVYYYLALTAHAKYLDKAVEYASKASEKERLYITSLKASTDSNWPVAIAKLDTIIQRYPDEKEAYYRTGRFMYGLQRFDEAIEYFQKAIAIDSLYKEAYNLLAYSYNAIDDYENSILAINEYINMVPDEANPYDTRGELYAAGGEIDKAIESYEKALEIKPDFRSSLTYLGYLHMQRQEYDVAEEYFQRMTESIYPSGQAEGRYYIAIIDIHRGQFQAALDAFDSLIVLERQMELHEGCAAYKHRIKAFIYRTMGKLPEALEEIETCLEIRERVYPTDRISHRHFHAQLLAENGRFEEAREVAEDMKAEMDKIGCHPARYWYALGVIEEVQGNIDGASEYYRQAAELTPEMPYHFMYGKSLLAIGQTSKAVREFEKLARNLSLWRLSLCMWDVKLHYYLGMAYEQSRWYDKAIEEYEIFLTFWNTTNPEIPETADARERLNRLKAEL